MIELLQTFVFLEIIPVNFFRRVFNPTFFFKLKSKYLEITTVSFPEVKSDLVSSANSITVHSIPLTMNKKNYKYCKIMLFHLTDRSLQNISI